ncbi:MAG: ANTAR domain-containing protein [Planctomycetota bacterium]|jgi:hypothetical protein
MLRIENHPCVLAGLEQDLAFWRIERRLPNLEVWENRTGCMKDLVRQCQTLQPVLCLISTSLINNGDRERFLSALAQLPCPVIVAGEFKRQEDEYRVREAGIYCFLLLPDEIALIPSAVQGAIQVQIKRLQKLLVRDGCRTEEGGKE